MELRVHLKVCEGCGCLWYRAQVETRVYCTACDLRFKEFPTPESRKRRGRPKKTTLPAVFAVQAPVETQEEEEFAKTTFEEAWRGEPLLSSKDGDAIPVAAIMGGFGIGSAACAGGAQ